MEMYTFPTLLWLSPKRKIAPDGRQFCLEGLSNKYLFKLTIESFMSKNIIESNKSSVRKKTKKKVLSARFLEIEYLALKKRAKDAGVTLSKFTRAVLLSGKIVQRISKSDADILRKLAGEANNLNQLARVANREGFKNVASDVINLRGIIVGIIKQLSNDWKSYEKSSI